MNLLKSSTCFEHYPAHLQEVYVVNVYWKSTKVKKRILAKGGETESCDSLDALIFEMREAAVCLQYSLQLRQSHFLSH